MKPEEIKNQEQELDDELLDEATGGMSRGSSSGDGQHPQIHDNIPRS